jgi:hypothetical protein
MRRSTVLSLALQLAFPGYTFQAQIRQDHYPSVSVTTKISFITSTSAVTYNETFSQCSAKTGTNLIKLFAAVIYDQTSVFDR